MLFVFNKLLLLLFYPPCFSISLGTKMTVSFLSVLGVFIYLFFYLVILVFFLSLEFKNFTRICTNFFYLQIQTFQERINSLIAYKRCLLLFTSSLTLSPLKLLHLHVEPIGSIFQVSFFASAFSSSFLLLF